MIGDLNEMAVRIRPPAPQPAREIPVIINGETRLFHELTDDELKAAFMDHDAGGEGWRWARAIARLLAGLPPRPLNWKR